jgi:hypothetical protein
MLGITWILCLDRYDIGINLDFEDAWVITDRGAQFWDSPAQFGPIVYEARLGAHARGHERRTDQCRKNLHVRITKQNRMTAEAAAI